MPKRTISRTAKAKRLQVRRAERGLDAAQIVLGTDAAELAALTARVQALGGTAIGGYREPFSGRPVLLATLPITAVAPTPFQRDL
ncbi:MAG: chromosome partitioning protein ParB, partial [Gammaproteobacteria bacterium]|nr:chromosome partitioning protein ParB [Gammaproteobacteria bacterium]